MVKSNLFVADVPVGNDGLPIIRKLLVANRGEIACRVFKTCQLLGVRTVAVFTESDRHSIHVELADEAVCLGPIDQEDGNPHLNIELLIKIAKNVGADSIHPGYGYLSENSDFAGKVLKANLIFIGPTPNAITTLGDKRTSKQILLARAPSISLIPGYNGSEQDLPTLTREAERIGFPIMIKASAGGGGKGMRIVHNRSELGDALTNAQSEAQKSFGSSDCILEKYIEKGKHIEIQILGDSHGAMISLLDRDCSIQRRHQKVIEESPSPWLTQALRQELSEAACRIGELIEYQGAGTVEFMVDLTTSKFYFLEVNARIQVEHPITEEVTGVDIVALQLYVAAGGQLTALPEMQSIEQRGHAIECRLCAEDPNRGFIPDLGKIWRWSPATEILGPERASQVRFETAIRTGSDISVYFDSMIAKVIVWAPTRALAISKMTMILANTVCIGVRSNQLFLQSCLSHSGFKDPGYSTNFIPTYLESLLKNPYIENFNQFQQLMSFIPTLIPRNLDLGGPCVSHSQPFKNISRGFRNQTADKSNVQSDVVLVGGSREIRLASLVITPFERRAVSSLHTISVQAIPEIDVKVKFQTANEVTAFGHEQIRNILHSDGGVTRTYQICSLQNNCHSQVDGRKWITADLLLEIDGRQMRVFLATDTNFWNKDPGTPQRVFCHFPDCGTFVEYHRYSILTHIEALRTRIGFANDEGNAERDSKAPMPCRVLRILKKNGTQAKQGEVLMVIESMKMEMNILAALPGRFECNVKVGDAIDEGGMLCSVL